MINKSKNVFLLIIMLAVLVGCSSKSSDADDTKLKVAVVVNQRFGDKGPMDDLAMGLDRAVKDFGVVIKKLESESASKFEEDIRAMSKAKYDLVITTFPYMTDATKLVSLEYPDTKYSAIFQFINDDKTKIENIWDTEFHGEQAFYLAGYAAGKLTESNKVGLLIGGEEPTPNAEGNGFMRGVYDANPQAVVEFAFVGSYEDPAKAKEITSAMISKGVDVVQTNAGASNAGVVEVCSEAKILCSGEITDFYDTYNGFYGIVGIGFGETAYKSIEMLINDKFEGGSHGIRDLSNGGYFMDWQSFTRFANDNQAKGALMTEIINEMKMREADIKDGKLKIDFDITVPNWMKTVEQYK